MAQKSAKALAHGNRGTMCYIAIELTKGVCCIRLLSAKDGDEAIGTCCPGYVFLEACIPHMCQYLSPDIFGYCTAFLKFR